MQAVGPPALEHQELHLVDNHPHPINAAVHPLGAYSAHADQKGLLDFAIATNPRKIKLVHGEKSAQSTLRKILHHHNLTT